jgi:hypothetical protein
MHELDARIADLRALRCLVCITILAGMNLLAKCILSRLASE